MNLTEEDLLRTSKAGDILNKDIERISEDSNIESVLKLYSENDSFVYPVISREKKMVGVITMEKLKDTFMTTGLSQFLLAHDIMIDPPCVCTSETPAPEVYRLMRKKDVDYIPVVNSDGTVDGLIEKREVRRTFSRIILEKQKKAQALG